MNTICISVTTITLCITQQCLLPQSMLSTLSALIPIGTWLKPYMCKPQHSTTLSVSIAQVCYMPAVILTAPYLNNSGTCVCPNVFLPQQFKYSEIDSITHEWVSPEDTLDTLVWVGD